MSYLSFNKQINCPLCGVERTMQAMATHLNDDIQYSLYECSSCTAQFWLPLKNPGATWYEHDTRYAGRNADPILKPNKKHTDIIHAYKGKPGRVLDVGCGVGNFLAYAKAKGWEPWGIDFDQDAIDAGKKTFGIEHLYVMDLATFATTHPERTFDLITFFDVFEHLDDHHAFMALVTSLLTPGGSIAFSLPYRHGWRWLLPNDLPPRHLTRWDEHALEVFFSSNGFHISYIRRLPASLYYLVLKFRYRYGKWASFGLVQKAKEKNAAIDGQHPHMPGSHSAKVKVLGFMAKMKDFVLFGTPALLVWLVLLPTRARYTDLYAIAERK